MLKSKQARNREMKLISCLKLNSRFDSINENQLTWKRNQRQLYRETTSEETTRRLKN